MAGRRSLKRLLASNIWMKPLLYCCYCHVAAAGIAPPHFRLRLADGLVLALYLLAYVCNLIATPIDDQLTFEARRDVNYWALPLQQSFLNKVTRRLPGLVVLQQANARLYLRFCWVCWVFV